MLKVLIDLTGETLNLCAVAELGALSVRAEDRPAAREVLVRALHKSGAGEVVDDHVWVDVAWLRGAAGDRDQSWHAGFETLLDYARSRDWLSPDGRRVRAHIEWLPRPDGSARTEN